MSARVALLVEDAPEFARLGQRVLEREGYEVVLAGSGEEALGLVADLPVELFVIDVGLPGIDGFELCRRLRTVTDAYVVMVTSRHDEVEKVTGLRIGADDYVTKPYSPVELAARIQALRRRPRAAPDPEPQRHHGRLEVDVDLREVRVDGRVVALTRIEFDLLEVLSSAGRRVVTRRQLLESVWGFASGDDHVVSVHLGNLRRKLRAAAGDLDPITTVRGVGYRFDAPS